MIGMLHRTRVHTFRFRRRDSAIVHMSHESLLNQEPTLRLSQGLSMTCRKHCAHNSPTSVHIAFDLQLAAAHVAVSALVLKLIITISRNVSFLILLQSFDS